jgi:hypothetical protein
MVRFCLLLLIKPAPCCGFASIIFWGVCRVGSLPQARQHRSCGVAVRHALLRHDVSRVHGRVCRRTRLAHWAYCVAIIQRRVVSSRGMDVRPGRADLHRRTDIGLSAIYIGFPLPGSHASNAFDASISASSSR